MNWNRRSRIPEISQWWPKGVQQDLIGNDIPGAIAWHRLQGFLQCSLNDDKDLTSSGPQRACAINNGTVITTNITQTNRANWMLAGICGHSTWLLIHVYLPGVFTLGPKNTVFFFFVLGHRGHQKSQGDPKGPRRIEIRDVGKEQGHKTRPAGTNHHASPVPSTKKYSLKWWPFLAVF